MNPHNDCITDDPPGAAKRIWRCTYCGLQGEFDQMMGPDQPIECTYVYPPCTTCGQTPICAADCAAVLGALVGLTVGG